MLGGDMEWDWEQVLYGAWCGVLTGAVISLVIAVVWKTYTVMFS